MRRAKACPRTWPLRRPALCPRNRAVVFRHVPISALRIRLARFLSKSLYRVRLGHFDEDALRDDRPGRDGGVRDEPPLQHGLRAGHLSGGASARRLSYAVGEWARVWPLCRLIQAMGAYFIRRKSRGELYRRVLARYVQMATDGGVTQAMFPEGGLSLDGRAGAAQAGLAEIYCRGLRSDGRAMWSLCRSR